MIYIAVTSQTARAVWFGQTARRRLGKVQTANRGKSQVWHTPVQHESLQLQLELWVAMEDVSRLGPHHDVLRDPGAPRHRTRRSGEATRGQGLRVTFL